MSTFEEFERVLASVFFHFENFLRKIGKMDLFDTLLFNYRLKDVQMSLSVVTLQDFSMILKGLLGELENLNCQLNGVNYDNILRPCSEEVGPESTYSCNDVFGNTSTTNTVEDDFLDNLFSTNQTLANATSNVPQVQFSDPQQDSIDQPQNRVQINPGQSDNLFANVFNHEIQNLETPFDSSSVDLERLTGDLLNLDDYSRERAHEIYQGPQVTVQPISFDEKDFLSLSPLVKVDSTLPFFCCEKCVLCFRTDLQFSQHKCSSTQAQLILDLEKLKALKKLTCGICEEEYRSAERMQIHINKCYSGPYFCEICSQKEEQRFSFDSMKLLNEHKRSIHSDQNPFNCNECGVSFKYKCSLSRHKVKAHEGKVKDLTCTLCNEIFTKKIKLTLHRIQFHNLQRDYLCQTCGSAFISTTSLSAHIKSLHAKNKRFICPTCSKVFSRKDKLTIHLKIHNSQKDHLCHLCGKGFPRKTKLDDHLSSHLGMKKYKCKYEGCSKSFGSNKDLKLHSKKLHENQS